MASPPLRDSLSAITDRIRLSAESVKRNPAEITLIAVTKAFPPEIWQDALNENLTCIGESRVLEAAEKEKNFPFKDKIELHLIGHLQSNKARKAIELFDVVQTIDSIKLARRINVICAETGIKQRIFIQVNTGNDPDKQGFSINNAMDSIREISEMKHLICEGIMTIPPNELPEKKLLDIYRKTRKIRDMVKKSININCKYLSMGMSNDFETAIKEGATHIRIGQALFGKRQKQC